MSEIDVFQLIKLVEERRVLWDRSVACYRDKIKTEDAWKEICIVLREDFGNLDDEHKRTFGNDVTRKWINIRDSWLKWQKKYHSKNKHEGKKIKTYVYHRHLEFLKANMPEKYSPDKAIATKSFTENASSTSSDKRTIQCSSTQEISNDNTKFKRKRENVKEQNKELILDSTSNAIFNSKIQFFEGISMFLGDFNIDETLEFQMAVLQMIKDIKNRR